MSEVKSWFFFFKTGKIDKPLARLGKKRENSNTIKYERGGIADDTTETLRMISNSCDPSNNSITWKNE